MRNESALKSAFMKEIKASLPGFVALRHEDVRTAGIPDLSLTGCGKTSWWEFKHSVNGFDSTGIQELTMLRLSAAGFARYVIFEDKRGIKRTLVLHPKHLSDLVAEAWCVGFDMRWLVEQVRKAHDL